MKKMTAMLMILTMMCTLAACGGSLMPTQPAPSAETSGAGEQQTEGKGGESQAAATETPVTEEVPATEAPAGAESSAEAVPAQETEPAPAETTQAAETENPSEAETIDPAEAQIEPDPYTPSDIRILPETLYLDDTVVGQQTVPGPDAGDYSKYQPEMFYGSWRVEDEGKFRDHSVTKAIFEETVTDFRGAEAAAEVLPWYLRFGIYNTDSVYRALSLHLDKATTGYITYGTGAASGEDHGYLMVYDVSGDTLAIGFFAVARDEILQGNHAELKVVREVRYRIVEWTGCRLTLQYGDRRVTYIPDMKLKQVNGVYELNWTGRHYLSKNCEVRDRLLEIGDTGNSGLTFDYGSDFYIPGGITLNPDFTATLTLEDGAQPQHGPNEHRDPFGTLQAGKDGKVCVVRKDGSRIYITDAMEWTYEAFCYSQNAITLKRDGQNQVFLTTKDWDNEHLVWDRSVQEMVILPEETKDKPVPTGDDDIRILPKVLHCDDSLIGQVTEPGPDAGDYSLYQPEMFFGRWRVEDDGKYNDHSVTPALLDGTLIKYDNTEVRPEVLPWYFGFGIFNEGPYYKSLPLYLDTATSGYCTFGTGSPTPGSQDVVMMVYDVSGDTLAVGFVDVARDDIRDGNYADVHVIRELRYKIVEWTGCRLTLQYGDRQATYIPDVKISQTNGVYQLNWGSGRRLSINSSPKGNPYMIKEESVAFNNGLREDWKIPSKMLLNEDGTATLTLEDGADMWLDYSVQGKLKTSRDGKVCAYKYEGKWGYSDEYARLYIADRMVWDFEAFYYSQSAITLRDHGSNMVYLTNTDWDNHHLVWDYDAEKVWLPAEKETFEGTSININGVTRTEDLGYTVGELIELGFATEEDVTAMVESRIVCAVFPMTKYGIRFDVRAVNPYGQPIPLNDCIVCYFGFDDTTGAVTLDGAIRCGTSKRDDVAGSYKEPFIDKEDHLVYQTSNPDRDYGNAYGAFVISEDVRTADVLFRFDEKGTLTQIVFLAPYLLYNTLAGNLGEVDLGKQDPDELDEVLRVRDEILDQLKAAFEREGINVAIDPVTGKITLDNKILFGFNRYDLTDEGKAYIDSFLKVYAEVLLSGDHADAVAGVRFDGHTDTVGRYEYNQELSEKRANTVLEYCVGENNSGMTPEQVETFKAGATAVGHSFDEPIVGPDGKVDMDASRRVEINFFLKLGE